MRDRIVSNLTTRFDAFDALVAQLDDEALHAKLDIEKHKSLAEHLWCVVGSRESYAKAITEGSWSGFACSVSSFSKADFTTKLIQSAELVVVAIGSVEDWSDERERLLADLAEHEVMHEGQIIRHVLGTGNDLPSTWKWA